MSILFNTDHHLCPPPPPPSFSCVQSYKASTIVNYDPRVKNTPYYNSRLVNYEGKLFIRMATDQWSKFFFQIMKAYFG